ncbi:tRNA epoxyqueuosine(34) reductase QueG [Rhizobium sp. SSA_523]|uniref:tRNA epoxyqueuosine(34) reductase QueG n=1 Tax=Rhizobium sp. SSA_523 TaxID=2952477 RepID=UPI0020906F53|nr:tRNA epoxyqueuosine(34) reductase QueG [Rhizobium sp. SSA_523]MCO5732710.1 tRNA epoxyqueuosine(34) reductase QueG [Rhizobium sp. SSA_523]WKC23664.1 tRNA epoxyqueuosine(34) reductase QueG [Rhizobium sp. SSA_523]
MRISTSDHDSPAASVSPKDIERRRKLTAFLRAEAAAQGFDLCRITLPDRAPQAPARLAAFVEAGRHGTMSWMEETQARRADPRVLWSEVRSIVMFGMNYGPDEDPRAVLDKPDRAAISVYARNRDYHDVIKGRLKEIATRFAARAAEDVKVFVDTAPVMEKPLAEAAGLGWQGKHTNLVSRMHGSWLFLGSLFTTAELEIDAPERDHCGSCRACLDACPTNAFPAPYQIDARRCISYLTIEHKGPIDPQLRPLIGNRIYGCDDCLAACPWNKFAAEASEMKLKAREDLKEPRIETLLTLDDSSFRSLFSGSPVKRIGRDRFVRNVLIAAGNSGRSALIEPCLTLLRDPSPTVRAMAVWALSRLMEPEAFAILRATHAQDGEPEVRAEWQMTEQA